MLISSPVFNRSKKHVHSSGEQKTIYRFGMPFFPSKGLDFPIHFATQAAF